MHCFIHRHHYIILLLRLSLLLLLLLLQHLFLHVHVTFSFFILPPSDTWCFVVRHLISVVPAEPMSYTHVGTCTNPAHTHMHTLILGCCAHTQLLGSYCLPPNDSTVHTLNVCVVVVHVPLLYTCTLFTTAWNSLATMNSWHWWTLTLRLLLSNVV